MYVETDEGTDRQGKSLKIYYPYWIKFGPWGFCIHTYELKEWRLLNRHAVMFDM